MSQEKSVWRNSSVVGSPERNTETSERTRLLAPRQRLYLALQALGQTWNSV